MEEYYIIKVVDGKVVKVLSVESLPKDLEIETETEINANELSNKETKEHEYLDLKIALVKKLIEQTGKKKNNE